MRFAAAAVAIVLAGWVLFVAPRGFLSGDEGVKLVQAHDLWESGFRSRALRKDPAFAHYLRAGAGFERDGQGIYSIAFVAPAAVVTGVLGARGLPVLPLAGGILIVLGTARLLAGSGSGPVSRPVASAALAFLLATPILFYSSQFFEHSLAVGLVTLALADPKAWRAGVLAGGAAMLRPECYVAIVALAAARPRSRETLHLAAGALSALAPYWIVNHFTAGAWDPLVAQNLRHHASVANALVMTWGELQGAKAWTWALPIALAIAGAFLPWRRTVVVLASVGFAVLAWRAGAIAAARVASGFFTITPLAGIGLLAGPRRPAWIFAVVYLALACALERSGTGGGLQLGARLLLPALPALIACAAHVVDGIPDARRASLAAACVALVASVAIDARGTRQANAIARDGDDAVAHAIAGPGRMIVAKLDWQAGVLAPALLSGKDVLISNARPEDTGIFVTLRARGDAGCVYVSRDAPDTPTSRVTGQHRNEILTVWDVSF
jgi:hypothetical protein